MTPASLSLLALLHPAAQAEGLQGTLEEALQFEWSRLEDGGPALATSSGEGDLSLSVHITLTPQGISVDGHPNLVRLVAGQDRTQLPEDQLKGQLIVPLYDVLQEKAAQGRAVRLLLAGDAPMSASVMLTVDRDVPFAVARSVMYTAGQAQFGHFQFVVDNPWLERLAVVDTRLPAIGPPQPIGEMRDFPEHPPLNLSVAITDQGLNIHGGSRILDHEPEDGPMLPCPDRACTGADSYDWAGLSDMLGRVKADYPDEVGLIVVPEAEVDWQVLIRTIDTARWAPLPPPPPEGTAAHAEWRKARSRLFDRPVVAGGAM